MEHLDEHTIELYVLGSDLIKDRIGDIEAHLRECHGCRLLSEQIKVFYENAEKELEYQRTEVSEPGEAIIKRGADLDFLNQPFSQPVGTLKKRHLVRFLYFVYSHPVKAALGGVSMMALVATAMYISISNPFKDKNPSYPVLDPINGCLSVYNNNDELLWSVPSKNLHGTTTEQLTELYKYVQVFDLNEDGKNEVITALPLGDQILRTDTLKIISYDKRYLRRIAFEENIQINGDVYETRWSVSEIHCWKYRKDSKPEIFLLADNGRSPTILFRLDGEGNTLGKYVHYGFMNKLFIDTSESGNRLFLCGQNDLGEVDSLSSPVLVALDPNKIYGSTESSCTALFGLEMSKAEIFYIRFPLTDMNYLWKSQGYTSRIVFNKSRNIKRYSAWVVGRYNKSNPIFEYVMSEDMRVLEVKYDSATLQLRQKLLEEGMLKGTFDDEYLENLKSRVVYWDGLKWQKDVTKVNSAFLTSVY